MVVDLATSKRAWGQVRLANKYGTNLPEDTFYDSDGNITLDPAKANSVKSFGDYKGFSLALLIEVICGALVGMDMLVQSDAGNKFGQKMPDRGAFILVIDPEQTIGRENFKQATTAYLNQIRKSKPLPGQRVRIPGDEAGRKQAEQLAKDTINLPDELWQEIQNYSYCLRVVRGFFHKML